MKLEIQTRIQKLKIRVEAERRARPGLRIRYSASCKQEAIALLDDGVTHTDLMRLVSIDASVMRKWQQKRAAVECTVKPKRLNIVETPAVPVMAAVPVAPQYQSEAKVEATLPNGIVLRNLPLTTESLLLLLRCGV